MHLIIVDLLYGLTTAFLGAAVAWFLCWSHFHRQARREDSVQGRHAAEVLTRLQELATRVAIDVDEHSTQMGEINDRLTAPGQHDPAVIVDVVARLIQTNQQMQQKLVTTEDRLRDQAQQIQFHVAEARTDALTLLANRRAFDDELARRIAEFRRHRRTFSLIMVDVDRFKTFNDTHGHQTGDEVLRGVAKLLRRKMREMELVARFGGEEFAIVLPGTNLGDASRAALRAGEAIAKNSFRFEEKELRVTVSLGVAEVRGEEDGALLIARADKALYAAKEGGRNCAYRHDGETVARVAGNQVSPVADRKAPPAGEAPQCNREKIAKAGSAPKTRLSEPESTLPRAVDLDAASDLPSRTTFCQQVRNRAAEWKRGGPTFSMVLMEVDHFEQGGADAGQRNRNAATLAATQFLTATIREMDTVGHYAPGCFALLLPTAGLVDAIRVAERLRQGFSEFSQPTQCQNPALTLSVGVVQIMEKDDSISLLMRAEAALDAADRRGGNRAYYHDGERCVPITAMLETMDYLA
jgi:diguanylate cyclase